MPDQPYSSSAFLFEVDVRDPEFRQHCRVWAMLMQSDGNRYAHERTDGHFTGAFGKVS